MMKRTIIAVAMIIAVMGMIVPASVFAADKPKFAIVFKNTGNPYGEKQLQGFKDGIQEQGYEAILRSPELPTAEAQIQIIEQLIAQRVASICIVGNDYDALQPVLTKASKAGIKVFSLDSSVNPASRLTHVNQADSEKIGQTLIKAAYDMTGGKGGEIAILSATSQASNQNIWIDFMKKELAKPQYASLKLVKIAYGDDLRDKSVSETEALLRSYPNLKVIIAPTTVGIAAAAKVITDKNLIGKVFITGLGLPSEMATYIENGACPYMFLWNPIDVGYLGAYVATALVNGKITGAVGEKFSAGRLGNYTITKAPDGGTEVLLGPPFKFDKSNIAEWKNVY
ncbi:MAG TPA: rhamnose ABC transporter substrate-binding protein [Spirochaetales bacterium]|nr:rhamnose ABC transporter substrate-binding protein [Spirochaetales bacterium]HPS15004.1 rhamnose ABC transporter substrate-binding protein [Spirochaetales bacterium]